MSDNGHPRKSVIGDFIALLEDQVDLVSLEWQYEKWHNLRRLAALAAAAFLGLSAFIFCRWRLSWGSQPLACR